MLPLLFLALAPAMGDTPEKTFEELKTAVVEKDWKAFYGLLVPSEKEEMNRQLDLMRKSEKGLARLAGMLEEDAAKVKAMPGKEAAILLLGKMAERQKEKFEKEIGKIRNGTIRGKETDGDACTVRYTANDEEGKVELLRVDGVWYYSMMTKSRRAANERSASAGLKTLVVAEADFRANDRDGDQIANYWVKDVAGLHGLEAGGRKIALIMIEVARADATEGKGAYSSVGKAEGWAGYRFLALKKYVRDGESKAYDDGTGRNVGVFGFAAVPVKYGQFSRKTFIVNEAGIIYSKDTRGQIPDTFPENPKEKGWDLLD